MSFRKVVCSVMAAAVLVTSLAGCSKSQNATSTGNTAAQASSAPAKKTKIKVWTQSRHDQNYMTPALEKFTKENKDGIEVEYQIYADNYYQAVEMAFAAGEAPDVFQDSGGTYTKMMPLGYMIPLDKYITPEFKKRFGEGAFIEGLNMQDGKIYTLPSYGSSVRLFYNKGIFEKAGLKEPPKTLDQMVQYAKTITEKLKGEGIYGFAINLKSPTSGLNRLLDPLVLANGGTKNGYDFKNGKFDFSSYKPVLTALREIFSKGYAFPGCESLDIDPLRTQFAAGKIGMYTSYSSADPGVYQNQFPTKENWDVAQVPTLDGTFKGSLNKGGPTWYMISSKSKNPDLAWKVVEYLYSDEVLSGYYEQGLGFVVVPSVLAKAKKPEVVQKYPALEFTQNDQLWPANPSNVIPEGKEYCTVFAGVLMGAVDIDTAINDVNTRYNAAFEKAISEGKTKRIKYDNFDPKEPGKSAQK